MVNACDFVSAKKLFQQQLLELTGSEDFKLCGHPMFLVHLPIEGLYDWSDEVVPGGFDADEHVQHILLEQHRQRNKEESLKRKAGSSSTLAAGDDCEEQQKRQQRAKRRK